MRCALSQVLVGARDLLVAHPRNVVGVVLEKPDGEGGIFISEWSSTVLDVDKS